jgi:hypothetical protein
MTADGGYQAEFSQLSFPTAKLTGHDITADGDCPCVFGIDGANKVEFVDAHDPSSCSNTALFHKFRETDTCSIGPVGGTEQTATTDPSALVLKALHDDAKLTHSLCGHDEASLLAPPASASCGCSDQHFSTGEEPRFSYDSRDVVISFHRDLVPWTSFDPGQQRRLTYAEEVARAMRVIDDWIIWLGARTQIPHPRLVVLHTSGFCPTRRERPLA